MTRRSGSTGLLQTIRVAARSARATHGVVIAGYWRMPCALGRGGIRADKREGDGATPRGRWPVRRLYYRADHGPRPGGESVKVVLKRNDGWCDAPGDRNYNRFVHHPYPASAERLWRDDALYDLVLVLGHNDRPRRRGMGSAIFVHLARPGYRPTEGCVALSRRDLRLLVSRTGPRTRFVIG